MHFETSIKGKLQVQNHIKICMNTSDITWFGFGSVRKNKTFKNVPLDAANTKKWE